MAHETSSGAKCGANAIKVSFALKSCVQKKFSTSQ